MSNDNKYNNGKIYTIRCKEDNNLIYVGSTVQPLYKRWHQHKCNTYLEHSREYNKYLYIKMRELGIDNFYIELYEQCICNTKEELNKREGQVIREIGTLNKVIAGRTHKEYQDDNKEKIKEYKTKYYEENKDHKKEYDKERRSILYNKINEKISCECGGCYTQKHMTTHFKTEKHITYLNKGE